MIDHGSLCVAIRDTICDSKANDRRSMNTQGTSRKPPLKCLILRDFFGKAAIVGSGPMAEGEG
ncbi:hypothetical protein, partial [Streptomyces brasiliscabiei]|uniref:hypothetical protein n=1 Tax=Streptomyces brasiliscabiei TaxID=2736302 RepID=UPI0030157676